MSLLSDLECFWCTLKRKELIGKVLVFLELVNPDFVHLDLSFGDIKLQTLWFFSADLVMGFDKHVFVPRLQFVSKSYSKSFRLHIL